MLERRRDKDPAAQAAAAASPPRARFGLTQRVLLLIVFFVMLAEVFIYVPSIANYRNNWLRDRLASARTAALVLEAAPQDMLPEDLKRQLLDSVGAKTIVLKMHDTRRLLAVTDMPPKIDESFDLRDPTPLVSIAAAFRTLASPAGRILNVVGLAPMGGEFVEITLDETPLQAAMRGYSVNILLLSLVISAFVAGLAALALHLLVLRPVRRLTSSLMEFGANPENASGVIAPSGRTDEIGRAEEALASMQRALTRELTQKKHLAALGLAVAKINHDLRNMLAAAQLFSDRLSAIADPVAQRLAPKLVATLGRAIAFCHATLVYGSAAEPPPKLRNVPLRAVAVDVFDTVSAGPDEKILFRNEVPEALILAADPEHLFRILANLCRNAKEALEAAGASGGRRPLISIAARRDDTDVHIEVVDNGPGIPAAIREQLFAAFHGSTRSGGSGLGLAIAADLVRAHGGSIGLKPSDTGARFEIIFPDRAPPR